MIRALLILLGAALVALAARALWVKARAEGWSTSSMLATSVAVVLIGVLVVLAATGRLHWLIALGAALLPLLKRLLGALPMLLRFLPLFQKWSGRPAPGRRAGPQQTATDDTSEVATGELKMTLHHGTGHMDGEILTGPLRGRLLSELDQPELQTLLTALQESESRRLLTAYLDRHFADWHETHDDANGQSSSNGAPSDGMDPGRAYDVLGLEPGASEQEIVDAHRRLIQRLHPDRGGSSYLAATLNEAKEVLLKKQRK